MIVDVGFDLIRRAQAGEHQALTRLVETYQGPVYSLALAVMRDRADAADMTQETFVRLLRSLHAYRGDGSNFTSWVHRMTVNICLDALRRRQRSPMSSLEQQGESLRGAGIRRRVGAARMAPGVARVRKRGPLRAGRAATSQRQALTLHYLEDRPYDEIAASMGVPLNTVKSHILRGKERMLRLLAGHAQTGRRHRSAQLRLAPAT